MIKKGKYFLASCAVVALTAFAIRPLFHTPLEDMYRSSTAVYSADGTLLRLTLSNDQRYRKWVPLKNIPAKVRTSFLISEDQYFYSHPGFNIGSLVRAGWKTFVSGERRQGASTITMQLSRMISSFNSSTLSGKTRQLFGALWLEWIYSKDEILEAYLNLVPMGGNIEGVGAGSLIFFEKRVSETSWNDATLLAVIPQNPTKRTLLNGYNTEVKNARNRLLGRMESQIPLNERKLSSIDSEPSHIRDLPFKAPHFVYNVLDKFPGKKEVRTTLDYKIQIGIEAKLENYLSGLKRKGINNGSVLLIDWQNSSVVSWVGSASFFDAKIHGQVDGVTSLRSPGSALKPFIYALAIQQGLIHPGTILKDSPRFFGSYDPENFDGKFQGPLSAEDALNQSRNLPAVELMTKLNSPDLYDFLVSARVGYPRSREFYGHSIALGGYEVSLQDLVKLYSVFPRRGFIREISSTKEEGKKTIVHKELLSPESSFIALDMLSKASIHTERYSRLEKRNARKVSWKTGTSSGFRDAWTVGVFGKYVLGVWIGNFSGESNRDFIGREVAAPLFFAITEALKEKSSSEMSAMVAWQPPKNVTQVDICPVSGQLPGPHCEHKKAVNFIPGTSPIAKCDVHRMIWISKADGKISCDPDPKNDRPVVMEFWSSDILEIYKAAGLPRKAVPPQGLSCSKNSYSYSVTEVNPEILSPRENLIYSLRSVDKSQIIPFEGSHDSSAKELFWFVDNEFVGKSTSGKSVLWKARSGHFMVKAVDNLGRSSSRSLNVQIVQ